jgi:hypothetical protein
MNRKQLGILFVLVVIVGGAGLVIFNKQNQERSAGNTGIGQKVFADLPVNDVGRLTITQGTNEVNLVRKEGSWRVAERQDYPANFPQLSEFLLKARDLKAVQSEQVGPSQLGRLQLAPGQGTNAPTLVEFKGSDDRTIGTLLLGKMHMSSRRGPSPFGDSDAEGWPDGRYVMSGTNSGSVAVVSETFDNIEAKPGHWLNKDFIRIEKPRSIEVTFPEPTNSWKLVRETETGDWQLVDARAGEKLDDSKSAGVTSPFSSPSFTDVRSGDLAAGDGSNAATLVKVETFDGIAYDIKVGGKENDSYLVTLTVAADLAKERTPAEDEKPEDKERLDKEFNERQQKAGEKLKQEQAYQKWTYLVSTWTVEPLLKKRSELLEDEKDEADAENVSIPDAEPQLEDPPLPAIHSDHADHADQ